MSAADECGWEDLDPTPLFLVSPEDVEKFRERWEQANWRPLPYIQCTAVQCPE